MSSPERTVVLAAGDFPRAGGLARRMLESAARVVCCDGAARTFRRRLGRDPDVIVGDLDSLRGRYPRSEIVRVSEQETNDLEKALRLCRVRGWASPVVLGATGKRADHTLSNVFRALAYGVELVADDGRFAPLMGSRTFTCRPGSAVSVFAPDPATRMTSVGLEWPLDAVVFANLYCATLNRAVSGTVTLTADRPVYVYWPVASANSQGICAT